MLWHRFYSFLGQFTRWLTHEFSFFWLYFLGTLGSINYFASQCISSVISVATAIRIPLTIARYRWSIIACRCYSWMYNIKLCFNKARPVICMDGYDWITWLWKASSNMTQYMMEIEPILKQFSKSRVPNYMATYY